jgi:hypothetical protein
MYILRCFFVDSGRQRPASAPYLQMPATLWRVNAAVALVGQPWTLAPRRAIVAPG